MTMRVRMQPLAVEHCWSFQLGVIWPLPLQPSSRSERLPLVYLPEELVENFSVSTIMRIWWKGSKRGRAHRRQTFFGHRHIKTSSPVKVPQFRRWLGWEVAQVCAYFWYIIYCLFYLQFTGAYFPNSPYIYGSKALCWALAAEFHFLDLYTVGRTPGIWYQPVARPLPTHRTTQTQNKFTQTSMPQEVLESTIPVFERAKISCLRSRGHCDRHIYI
jgi:hypothetical protein